MYKFDITEEGLKEIIKLEDGSGIFIRRPLNVFKTKNIDFEKYRYPIKHPENLTFRFSYNPRGHITINLWNRSGVCNDDRNETNRKFFLKAVQVAKKMGYIPYKEREWLKGFHSIRKHHKWSTNGNVSFEAHYYPAGLELEFWAINKRYCITNRYDGIKGLPYIEHQRMKILYQNIKKAWIKLGATCTDEWQQPSSPYAYDQVAYRKYNCWHWNEEHDTLDIFSQQYTDGSEPASYNCRSREGELPLRNGQLKYFYDYSGILRRGVITHNLNNMWFVLANNYEYFNKSSGDLFDFVSLEETPVRKCRKYKIKQHIDKCVGNKDYLKAHLIQKNNLNCLT